MVVETAVTPDHGSATGTVFQHDPEAPFDPYNVAEIAKRASAAVAQEPDAQNSSLWKVRSRAWARH